MRLNQGFAWTEKGTNGVHYKSYLPNEEGYWEASWYSRGDRKFDPFDVNGVKVGMMICSDLWAMQHARGYGKTGVQLLVVPRATGKYSVEKWVSGGRVAAVISGAYCLSSNRSGNRGETEFGGAGWAVDPEGRVLGMTSANEPFVTVEIDPKLSDEAKKTYPRDSLEPD